MLKVDNVSKSYGSILAVDNLSFTVKKGEIFGLLGLNGAGKTTTFRMILGLIEADSGSITFNGKKIDYSVTDKLGFLTEERSLLTKLTVSEQLIYYGVLKGIKEEDMDSKIDYWLERFNIKEYKNRKIKELSKGNQQKVQFISSIINNPELLILDEPFSGLDPINVELFKKVILELKDKGTCIIFSSHRMEHVELFCDKLVILVKGRSVLDGYLLDIKNSYKKKNLFIKGDIPINKIKECDGVINIDKNKDEYLVSIKDNKYVSEIFKILSNSDNILKFSVEDISLNEIFISIVGDKYDK